MEPEPEKMFHVITSYSIHYTKLYDHLWELVAWASFHHRFRINDDALPQGLPAGDITAGFVIRDNLRHRRDIENAYLDAIGRARHSILIANAYFLPGRRFRRALVEAAGRGVAITILLQGQVEYRLQHYASYNFV